MIRQTSCIIARTSDPCRNLAIEKHLMDTLPEGTAILFLYRSENAVTVGRNQNPWYECDVEPFLESGGIITRRLTGGGTFYQDAGTLNFSIILPKTELNAPRQLALAASAAQRLGLPDQAGPCASLTTDGRIFCTNAFYKAGSTALHNGCILVSPDMEQMARSLLPGGKRYRGLERPAVDSLYTGVCNQLPDMTLDAMEEAL
jgi:lipoate-protein ligase A